MVTFTELGLHGGDRSERVRAASGTLTARRLRDDHPAHAELARQLEPTD